MVEHQKKLIDAILQARRAIFNSTLSVEDLGHAARGAGWEIPVYGGMFCARCSAAVRALSGRP